MTAKPNPLKNNPTILDRVDAAIVAGALVPAGTGVLVGVSGGPDSMALLDLLRCIGTFPLRAAHLNHKLRPGDCDADEALVRDYCHRWQISLDVEAVDVSALARISGMGLEAAGRQARHEFFACCANRWTLQSPEVRSVRIALAHHLDDQAETILLHLGRGCGLDGLTGMRPLSGAFIRPLLGIRRTEILGYLADNQVPWRLDTTNEQPFTLRNRLRQQVLPTWREALGYDPATVLARTAELTADDRQLLDQLTEAAWQRVLIPDTSAIPSAIAAAISSDDDSDLATGPICAASAGRPISMFQSDVLLQSDALFQSNAQAKPVCLDCQAFRSEPAALQNRLLRLAWRQASGQHRDIEWRHLRIARDFIREPGRRYGHLDWPQNVVIELDGAVVRIFCTGKPAKVTNS